MTLNVIVNNMVAVDSEATMNGIRTSDDFKKSELLSRESYHGVLVGNGSGFNLLEAISLIRKSSEADLDSVMKSLEQYQKDKHERNYQQHLSNIEAEIKTKYRLVSDAAKREELISKEFANAVEAVNREMSQQRGVGALHIVMYDKQFMALKKFILPDARGATLVNSELLPVFTDGSGGDLAGAYLATNTSGINWEKINPQHTFYLISLACAAATANQGVGGFMQIAHVEKDKVRYIDEDKANSAVRVCSKQIAGDLSKREAIRITSGIYNGTADYLGIAKKLDLTINDLLYSPCRLHQDVSKFNRMHERNHK